MRRRYRQVPLVRPEPRPDPELDAARSKEACPVCGKNTLSLLDFPHVATMGVQPNSDILGMGEPKVDRPPGIACLTCGSQWPDIDAFRRARRKKA